MKGSAPLAVILSLIVVAACRCAAAGGETAVAPPAAASASDPPLWFPVGEELVYRIYWGFIPVGKSRLTSRWIEYEGRRRILLRYRTRTNGLFDRIYPMDDLAETVVDPEGFRPIVFRVRLARRGEKCDETTVFDHDRLTAIWSSACEEQNKVYPIEADTRDILSFLYFRRSQPFLQDTEQDFRVVADDGVFPVSERTEGIKEVKLPVFGRVPSLEVTPAATFKGLLIENDKIRMWVSTDPRRLCTRIQINGLLANVKTILCQVHGPGDDVWTRAMQDEADKVNCTDDEEVERSINEE